MEARGYGLRDDILLLLKGKNLFETGLKEPTTFPCNSLIADWLLVEVALLLIGLTKISLIKSGFDHPSVLESPLRLRATVYFTENEFSFFESVLSNRPVCCFASSICYRKFLDKKYIYLKHKNK